MKKDGKILTIIVLIILLILGGFLGYGYYQKATYQRPVVSMEIQDYGTVKIELYPDMAPNTVKNFIKLINEGYYNGLTFHRVEDMLIQGGAKTEETAEHSINGEFLENGYDNTLKFERGTIGIARADYSLYTTDPTLIKQGYNSGYAQFFIMTQDIQAFDGYYCSFGKVLEGIEIVDEITKIETKTETNEETGESIQTDEPVNPPVISNVTVDTFGVEYGEPEINKMLDAN